MMTTQRRCREEAARRGAGPWGAAPRIARVVGLVAATVLVGVGGIGGALGWEAAPAGAWPGHARVRPGGRAQGHAAVAGGRHGRRGTVGRPGVGTDPAWAQGDAVAASRPSTGRGPLRPAAVARPRPRPAATPATRRR